MAQTGYTPISLYYSTTASTAPTAGNLVAGELAINTNDGILYYKDSSGVVQSIASKAGNSGSFTNLAYTGTLTGGTGIVNLGSGQFYKDASGNVGIGVTPSVWSSGKAIEVGYLGNAAWSFNQADIYYSSNTYYNSGWKYASSNSAGVGVYEINGNTHYWYGATAGTAGNSLSLTTILQLKQGNTLVLQGGTSSAGTGIAFPATQSASSDANTLDDYEEGTFTPTLAGSTGNPTVTYAADTYGIYTKIGNAITFSLEVRTTARVGGSGDLLISGLPFTSGSRYSECAVSLYNITFNTSYIYTGEVTASNSYLFIRGSQSAGTGANVLVSDWTTTGTVLTRITGTYYI